MHWEHDQLERARVSRDPRFDGRFFIGVKTTGIYCRPICPVRLPNAANVTFFPSAAAAAESGYRPCLRCRPETAPGTPAWSGTAATVSRGLRLIEEGALNHGSVSTLAERLGVTPRHLNRLFQRRLGASPKAVAQTRRIHFAKQLLDQTSLPLTEIAMTAGYGSVRRFNDHFLRTYGRSPSAIRNSSESADDGLVLRLPFRSPFNGATLMDFFRVRATPGVERVTDGSYRRTFCLNKRVGHFTVEVDQQAEQLLLSLHSEDASLSLQIVERVRRMFDLDADPREVAAGLAGDKTMTGLLAKTPGLRLPGAFDPFETAVRALVGQQVSVKGATTVMGKIVSAYGRPHGEDWLFPTPAVLAELDPEHLPMPVARATAIRTMASRVASGELDLSMAADPEQLVADLQQIKGIGPWTAQYIVMRGLSYPNAFLEKDLVLLKAARNLFGISTDEELKLHSRHWTPWRAYACLLLWQHASEI